jgi:glutamyl-tRNA reductase
MQVFLLGLSHKTAPVEVRERLAISSSHLPRALRYVRQSCGAPEAAILSTCNRTEIYVVGEVAVARRLERFLQKFQAVHGPVQWALKDLSTALYRQQDAASATHLFRVASGLESLVLGESEILGQVKTTMESAREQGALGPLLDELFRRAITCGKRVREQTGIGRGAMNVGSAAVELARQIFGSLKGRNVLILGAGKMSSLTARSLVMSGAHEVIVANRTHQRAQELAATLRLAGADAEAVFWDELPQRLVAADIVIASTHAPHVILTSAQVASAMKARRHRPLFLIDIAVPRDIEADAHQLDDVFLYNIDDLQSVVAGNRAARENELPRAEALIEDEVLSWQQWRRALNAQPVIAALAQCAERIRDDETIHALAKLSHLAPEDQEVVRRLAHAITGKLLHAPLRHLRVAGENGSGDVEALRRAFDLDNSESKKEQS